MRSAANGPRIISWNITLRCPLTCAHCSVDAGEQEADGVLSTQEAFGVIDQISETGKPVVVLSGGEPLMREDLYAIARYGTEQGIRMVMGTSGMFIDRTTAEQVSEAGIKALAVSLYSASPAVHDAFRGMNGVWEKAVQAIRNCRDEGIAVQINMSVMRSDINDIRAVIELGTTLGVNDYQIFFLVPPGRARKNGSKLKGRGNMNYQYPPAFTSEQF